jgi:hypothetical protein
LAGVDWVRRATLTKIGIINTTIGVSFITPLPPAQKIRSSSIDNCGRLLQMRENQRATGSSAPVTTRPRPRIMRAEIVISASWPKPRKKSVGMTRAPSC